MLSAAAILKPVLRNVFQPHVLMRLQQCSRQPSLASRSVSLLKAPSGEIVAAEFAYGQNLRFVTTTPPYRDHERSTLEDTKKQIEKIKLMDGERSWRITGLHPADASLYHEVLPDDVLWEAKTELERHHRIADPVIVFAQDEKSGEILGRVERVTYNAVRQGFALPIERYTIDPRLTPTQQQALERDLETAMNQNYPPQRALLILDAIQSG